MGHSHHSTTHRTRPTQKGGLMLRGALAGRRQKSRAVCVLEFGSPLCSSGLPRSQKGAPPRTKHSGHFPFIREVPKS